MAGTKAAAEAILRELPSVLGAYVREDVNGHPREVHILIRSGPDPRELSRDIRELLEERLEIPVDQRVISIAQLAPEDGNGVPDRTLTDRLAAPPAAARTREVVDAGPPTPVGVRGSRPARMDRAAAPRLLLEGSETHRERGQVTVTVRLSRAAAAHEGAASEPDGGIGATRAGARATLAAATACAEGDPRLELESVTRVATAEREVVLVTVVALSPRLGRRPRRLVGAHPVESQPELAGVLAALKAVDRTLRLPR